MNTAVFGANSSLPPLVDRRGRLVWSAGENVFLFSAHVDAKQWRDSFQQPHSCEPFSVLNSVAFWSSSIRSLLLDLNLYGGTNPDSMFLLFCKQEARELAPKLAVMFRHLVKRVSFPACSRLADIVLVPKGSPSSEVKNVIHFSHFIFNLLSLSVERHFAYECT